MPKGQYDRAASAWMPTPTKDYDPELVCRVREVYEGGATMRETSTACGVTVKVLQRLMPRHGIDRRRPVPRDQRGTRNPKWKGTDASYNAKHQRVMTARGKPNECVGCGATDPHQVYEWANLTGNYDDVEDFIRLCVPCHRMFDQIRRHELGTFTSPVAIGTRVAASGYTGVCWRSDCRRWQANGFHRGNRIDLGLHRSLSAAVAARAAFIGGLPRIDVTVGGGQ